MWRVTVVKFLQKSPEITLKLRFIRRIWGEVTGQECRKLCRPEGGLFLSEQEEVMRDRVYRLVVQHAVIQSESICVRIEGGAPKDAGERGAAYHHSAEHAVEVASKYVSRRLTGSRVHQSVRGVAWTQVAALGLSGLGILSRSGVVAGWLPGNGPSQPDGWLLR
jgi:hypothetical protein